MASFLRMCFSMYTSWKKKEGWRRRRRRRRGVWRILKNKCLLIPARLIRAGHFWFCGHFHFQRRPNGPSRRSSGRRRTFGTGRGASQLITHFRKSISHNFSTHFIVGLVRYSHGPELLTTAQVSPLKWLLMTPGQDSRDKKICGIAMRRLGELEDAAGSRAPSLSLSKH